jgi:hypothetical protein
MYIICARDPEGKPFVWLSKTLGIDWPSLTQGDGPFARELRKQGEGYFHVFLLEEVEDVYGPAWIDQCLGIWIRKLKADVIGYNVAELNRGEIIAARQKRKGNGLTDEHKKAMSEGHRKAVKEKGEWREHHPMTEEGRKRHAKKQAMLKNGAKDYIATDPQGNTYKITNLSLFCQQHNLNVGHMTSVAGGKRKHHKQWTCIKVEGKQNEDQSIQG